MLLKLRPAAKQPAGNSASTTRTPKRLNDQIRRHTEMVGIFPDRVSLVRLVGAVLVEQTDEWAETRRSMGTELLAKAHLKAITTESPIRARTRSDPA